MSFDTLEVSAQSGEPVELFKFSVGALTGFPESPPPPGALVLASVARATVRDEGTTTLGTCQPTSPDSGVCNGRGSVDDLFLAQAPPASTSLATLSVWGAYHGGLGGGGGWFFERITLSGLTPSHPYIVRTLAGTFGDLFARGVRIGTAPGMSENSLVGSHGVTVGIDGSATPVYDDTSITSSGSGEIVIDVGHFDLEVGYANVVYLDGLWLYDPAEDPSPTTPGGLNASYYYTSADVDVGYQGQTYLGGKASRFRRLQPFRPGLSERSRSEVELAIPRDHLVAALVRGVRAAPIRVTVYNLHRGDLTDARTPLQGEIADCRDDGPSCILTLAGKGGRLDSKLPILTTERDCTNTYSLGRCRSVKADFAYTGGVVTALEATDDGVIVTVSGAAAFARPVDDPDPNNYFVRGTIATADGFEVTVETVDPDDGDRLTIPFAPPGLVVGAAVTVNVGCPRISTVCHFRFGQLEDFMGEPTIPIRNPFGPAGLVVG